MNMEAWSAAAYEIPKSDWAELRQIKKPYKHRSPWPSQGRQRWSREDTASNQKHGAPAEHVPGDTYNQVPDPVETAT